MASCAFSALVVLQNRRKVSLAETASRYQLLQVLYLSDQHSPGEMQPVRAIITVVPYDAITKHPPPMTT